MNQILRGEDGYFQRKAMWDTNISKMRLYSLLTQCMQYKLVKLMSLCRSHEIYP